ncbi:MAG: hypothetical protein IPM56_16275 [Ignavibacteriales bacterium]|nr:MAG: hypothetical protein IPM56_16275 [Ignavibacteriales bacterium]
MENVIKLKIVIDGKEGEGTIDVMQIKSALLKESLENALTPNVNTAILKSFVTELLNINEASEEAAKGVADFIKYNDISEQEIEEVISALAKERSQLGINSAAYKEHSNAIANVTRALDLMNETQQTKVVPGSYNMNMAIMQSGYILNDASMITVNFRMAMMGVANNIPMVVQGIMAAKNEASGMGKTFGQLAMESIKGPGGILLAVNALMLVLQLLPGLFDSGTKSIADQKEELKKLRDEYAKLTDVQLTNYIQSREEELRKLQEKHPGRKTIYAGPVGEEVAVEVDTKGQARYGSDFNRVQTLEAELSALKETKTNLGEIENIENRISLNRLQREKLSRNEDSPYYWKNVVKTAESFEEARKSLEQYIAADEKLIASSNRNSSSTNNNNEEKTKLITTEKELREQLALVNAELLKQNTELDEENLKALRESIEEQLRPKSAEEPPIVISGEVEIEEIILPDEVISETEELVWLTDTLTASYLEAGRAAASAGAQSIKVFSQANSVLQIFINSLIQAVAEALMLKAVMMIFDFFSGGAASAATSFIPGAANGAIVTKPRIMAVGEGNEPEGVFPLSKLNQFVAGSGGSNLEHLLNTYLDKVDEWQRNITLESKIKNDHIHIANERAGKIRKDNRVE